MKNVIAASLLLTVPAFAAVYPAADARFEYTDCEVVTRTASGRVELGRSLPHVKRYHLDAPEARMRFRTDAKELAVQLEYGDRTFLNRAQNSVGVFLIDGEGRDQWCFTRPEGNRRLVQRTEVKLPADGKLHDYELVMPYGDVVSVLAVTTDAGARFEPPAPRPAVRAVFFGDSVTHGFTSDRIDHCYPYLVGRALGYEVVNLAYGGLRVDEKMATAAAKYRADVIFIALGVNDWQNGIDPAVSGEKMVRILQMVRQSQPQTRIVLITPLFVPERWQPAKAKYPLAQYRSALAAAAQSSQVGNVLVIDGATLIDHDEANFDKVAVHPSAAGFRQMAQRIVSRLKY